MKRRTLLTKADKEANEQKRVSAAAIKAAAKKKVEDESAAAKADKEKKAEAKAEEQKRVSEIKAAAKADTEKKAKEEEEEEAAEQKWVSAAAAIEAKKATANVDEEESKLEGVPAAVATAKNAAAANAKKFDIALPDKEEDSYDWTLNNKSYTDVTPSQLAQVAILKTIQEQMEAMAQKMDSVDPSKGRKSTEPKRAIGTRAQSIPKMKDEVVRRAYGVLIKYTEQIQFISQFKSQANRDYHPPFWTVLMNID
jgi:hypothetical protein